MAKGWRGAAQKGLRWLARRLEVRDDQKPTKNAIPAILTLLLVICATILLVVLLAATRGTAINFFEFPNPPDCTEPTCVQTAWQGRWTMWGAIFSGGMLFATAVSIVLIWQSVRAAREVQKQEFRAYIKPEIHGLKVNEDPLINTIQAFVTAQNYGRTPAIGLNGRIEIVLHEQDRENDVVWKCVWPVHRDALHPGKPEDITVGVAHTMDGLTSSAFKNHIYGASVALHVDFVDVFKERRRFDARRRFAIYYSNSTKSVVTVPLSPK